MSELNKLRDDCLARLDEALSGDATRVTEELCAAEREVAAMRDALITKLRNHALESRQMLDDVNGALSLIVGVEFPAAGIQRDALVLARDTLRRVLLASQAR